MRVSTLHFIEKLEGCLNQGLSNREIPGHDSLLLRRIIDFRKGQVTLNMHDPESELVIASLEIQAIPDTGKRTAFKGQIMTFPENESEPFFIVINGKEDLAVAADRLYQDFTFQLGGGQGTPSAKVQNPEGNEDISDD